MKKLGISLMILIIVAASYLTACSPGGSNNLNCSAGGEVCVTISTVQSFAKGNPVSLKIEVTSSKDISYLHVTLHVPGDVTIDGPQNWENDISSPQNETGYTGWDFSIKAGKTRTFTRVLHFPSKPGYFDVSVHVGNKGGTIDAFDDFSIVITNNNYEGKIIRAGTPLPKITPEVTQQVYLPGTEAPTFVAATMPWQGVPTPDFNSTQEVAPLLTTPAPLTSYPPPPSGTAAYP